MPRLLMHAPAFSITRIGVVAQVGHSPRFYALMSFALPITMAALLLSTARNAIAASAFSGQHGVGLVAIGATIGGGLSGILAGSLTDRFSPRALFVITNFGLATGTGILWLCVVHSFGSEPGLILLSLIDGGLIALSSTALVKLQSELVPQEAKGAAETLSGIRASAGSLIGVALGSQLDNRTDAILLAMIFFALVAITILAFTRNVDAAMQGPRGAGSLLDLLSALRGNRALRDVVIADLLMFLCLPSALIALGVAAEGIESLNPALLTAGIVGVLAGRLLVAARGTKGAVPRDLTIATVTYSLFAFLSFIALINHWLFHNVIALVAVATIGSACGSFVQALLSAKFQENLPGQLRGRGSGMMYGARSLQLTLGISIATWVISRVSLHGYLIYVGVVLLLVTCGLRGFRRIA